MQMNIALTWIYQSQLAASPGAHSRRRRPWHGSEPGAADLLIRAGARRCGPFVPGQSALPHCLGPADTRMAACRAAWSSGGLGADHAADPARRHIQVDAVERDHLTEALG
jgi:hypothetical protein